MNKSDKPTIPTQIPTKSDPELDHEASYQFGKIINKVKNRATARCHSLERDICDLICDFMKNNGLNPGGLNFRNKGGQSSTSVPDAVSSFLSGLCSQLQEKEIENFIESFSAKILEVSEAEKTSG